MLLGGARRKGRGWKAEQQKGAIGRSMGVLEAGRNEGHGGRKKQLPRSSGCGMVRGRGEGSEERALQLTPGCRLRSLRSLRPTWPLSRCLLLRRGRRGGQGFGLLANRPEPLVKGRGGGRLGVAPPPSASAGPVLRTGQVRQPKTLAEMPKSNRMLF